MHLAECTQQPPLNLSPTVHQAIIMSLASLFIERPAEWGAFAQLVPRVFETHLKIGTEPRKRLNEMLLKCAHAPALRRTGLSCTPRRPTARPAVALP